MTHLDRVQKIARSSADLSRLLNNWTDTQRAVIKAAGQGSVGLYVADGDIAFDTATGPVGISLRELMALMDAGYVVWEWSYYAETPYWIGTPLASEWSDAEEDEG